MNKYQINQKLYKLTYREDAPELFIVKGIELFEDEGKGTYRYQGSGDNERKHLVEEKNLFETFEEIQQYLVAEEIERHEERLKEIKGYKKTRL